MYSMIYKHSSYIFYILHLVSAQIIRVQLWTLSWGFTPPPKDNFRNSRYIQRHAIRNMWSVYVPYPYQTWDLRLRESFICIDVGYENSTRGIYLFSSRDVPCPTLYSCVTHRQLCANVVVSTELGLLEHMFTV
jgi:hypothetical protein